jgi:HEAT repeat protein
MRFPLLAVLVAASSAASAQTPRPAPAPPRPGVQAPRPAPRPMALMPELDAPFAWQEWRSFDLEAPEWTSLTWNVQDFAFDHLAPLALDWQMEYEPLLWRAPELQELAARDMAGAWSVGDEPRGSLARTRPDQGTPEDSLYRVAREALNRGEYTRASGLFQTLEQKYPRSRVAPAALYWRAFALYRAGSTDELKAGLETLKSQQERYPDAASDADVATLRTRLYAALASRGDASAATALRAATAAGKTDCDREDTEVRAEALNALAQINPPEARPTLKKVLARRDECSAILRRRAVYILGRNGTDESAADLLEVAKNDPDPSVRSDAIVLLGRSPGATTIKTLQQLFNDSPDERTREAVLSALRARGGPEAKQVLRAIIERSDLPERMRAEAIMQLAGNSNSFYPRDVAFSVARSNIVPQRSERTEGDADDAAYLRTLYGKTDSRTVKAAILSAMARIGGPANDQWLLAIVKNREEDTSLRREALSRLRTSALSIDELGKLFDALSERDLRYAVVSQLASRDDSAATDKLFEIARSGTDPEVRRQAISALARKKDPRTTKLLLDLLEKP